MEPTAGSRSSTEASAAVAAERVVAGRVCGAHGLRGQVRVRYFADDPSHLFGSTHVWIGPEGGEGPIRRFEVERAAEGRRGEVRLRLAGLSRREHAAELVGQLVHVDASRLEPLAEGEYYEYQLVGCRVQDEAGRHLGTVKGIWPTGAADVLVVEDDGGTQRLVPAAEGFLVEVDVAARRLVIRAIPGLLDAGDGPDAPPER